jgi:hypothetical protein
VTIGLALILSSSGCLPVAEGPGRVAPTSVEAHSMLARLVGLAQSGDFDGLCSVNGYHDPNCESLLDGAGDAPAQPPVVVAERTTDPTENAAAGRVLTLCGTGADGKAYRSEVLFFYSSGDLTVIQPVWWSNTGIADAGDGAAPSTETGQAPVGCS